MGLVTPVIEDTEVVSVPKAPALDPDLRAKCFCDEPLPAFESIDVFCLPVIGGPEGVEGLLLRLVEGQRMTMSVWVCFIWMSSNFGNFVMFQECRIVGRNFLLL